MCCYVNDFDIDEILGKDTRRFNALVGSKSKSRIRIDMHIKKEPEFKTVLEYLLKNSEYRIYCISIVERIISKMTENNINVILDNYPDEILSKDRKRLLLKFLLEKVKIIKTIFEEEG